MENLTAMIHSGAYCGASPWGRSMHAMVEGYRSRVSHEAIMEAVRLIMTQFVNTLPALEPA